MSYEIRLAAMNLARDITAPGSDASTLIENAKTLEAYLRGIKPKQPDPVEEPNAEVTITTGTISVTGSITGNAGSATKAETKLYRDWSGTALDLVPLLLSESVLLNVSRNIGTTSLLCDLAASMLAKGKRVLFFTNKGLAADDVFRRVEAQVRARGLTVDETKATYDRFHILALNRLDGENIGMNGTSFDIIIVDGLEFLPYGKETDFVQSFMPCSNHYVFAGVPAREEGLFYELWRNPNTFSKVALTWATPLFKADEGRKAAHDGFRTALGDDRFRNQYENAFRKDT